MASTDSRPVVLGVAGDYTTSAEEATHYATKVGGLPCLPGCSAPKSYSPPRCGVCHQQLSLVLQPGCGKQPAAWRVFRSQLPPTTCPATSDTLSTTQPASSSPPDPNPEPAADEWGANDWGDDDSATTSTTPFDFSALNSALDSSTQQLQSSPAAQKATRPAAAPSDEPGTQGLIPSCTLDKDQHTDAVLPEFYVTACDEPQGSKAGIRAKDLEHVQELLARYQQEESASGGDDGVIPQGPVDDDGSGSESTASVSAAAGRGSTGQDEAGSQGSGWAPEEYEEDEVRGVDVGYLKYQNRLMRLPEQCVRYGFKAEVLWPKKQPPTATPCQRCGAPRVFEFQILASLISLMMEATDLLPNSDQSAGSSSDPHVPYGVRVTSVPALTAAANWDMCSVGCFTCSRSCAPDAPEDDVLSGCWLEEQVALINEDECHVAMT